MTWSVLDLTVVAVFIAQLVGWFCVAWAAWKIKQGPVTRLQNRIAPLTDAGKLLATRSIELVARLKVQALSLVSRTKTIRKRLRVSEPPQGMWIEPRHLKQAAGFLAAYRQRPIGKKIVPKKKTPASVAQKLGLLPPVLIRLAPLGKIARIALQTLKQLRR
ncbi:hypothetical protein [Armatimonas sp.]|uniref:hypothetical protein n=1 Tax=Armatimonas sp. TaxID=1872638 RepID=UPI00286D3266|nr:hypothetical protein [Armatimonas sp.]